MSVHWVIFFFCVIVSLLPDKDEFWNHFFVIFMKLDMPNINFLRSELGNGIVVHHFKDKYYLLYFNCSSFIQVINFFVGLLFLRLLEQLGPRLLYTIFGTFCLMAVVFVKRNVMETKGKSLQEIEIALLPPEWDRISSENATRRIFHGWVKPLLRSF